MVLVSGNNWPVSKGDVQGKNEHRTYLSFTPWRRWHIYSYNSPHAKGTTGAVNSQDPQEATCGLDTPPTGILPSRGGRTPNSAVSQPEQEHVMPENISSKHSAYIKKHWQRQILHSVRVSMGTDPNPSHTRGITGATPGLQSLWCDHDRCDSRQGPAPDLRREREREREREKEER